MIIWPKQMSAPFSCIFCTIGGGGGGLHNYAEWKFKYYKMFVSVKRIVILVVENMIRLGKILITCGDV